MMLYWNSMILCCQWVMWWSQCMLFTDMIYYFSCKSRNIIHIITGSVSSMLSLGQSEIHFTISQFSQYQKSEQCWYLFDLAVAVIIILVAIIYESIYEHCIMLIICTYTLHNLHLVNSFCKAVNCFKDHHSYFQSSEIALLLTILITLKQISTWSSFWASALLTYLE